MRRMWCATILSATLLAPIGASAAPPPAADSHVVVVRVYDPYRHDYHRWDHAEQARYREYLRERHRSYLQYRRQTAAERRAYWHWRHEHAERER